MKLVCRANGENGEFKLFKRNYHDKAHFKLIKHYDDSYYAIIDSIHPIGMGCDSILLIKGYDSEIMMLKNKFEDEINKSLRIDVFEIIEGFYKREKVSGEYYGFIKEGSVKFAGDNDIEEFQLYIEENCKQEIKKILLK